MENHKCPVCRKPDIPNYHEEDVVCPQCKSDLSIYRVIDQIPSSSGKNIWKPMSAVAILAAADMGFPLVTETLNYLRRFVSSCRINCSKRLYNYAAGTGEGRKREHT